MPCPTDTSSLIDTSSPRADTSRPMELAGRLEDGSSPNSEDEGASRNQKCGAPITKKPRLMFKRLGNKIHKAGCSKVRFRTPVIGGRRQN